MFLGFHAGVTNLNHHINGSVRETVPSCGFENLEMMAATVSHEMLTPINAILNFTNSMINKFKAKKESII